MINEKNKITVGIISPSAPLSAFCPRRLQRGVDALERLGFNVKVGNNVSKIDDYTAGTIEERVSDIHDMFLDKEVDIIISTIGGYNANDLLDAIDYQLIKENNNKLFIGYSDITVLLISLMKFGGVQTVMGPAVLSQFGEFPDLLPYTKESFLHIVKNINSGNKYTIPISNYYTEEKLWWDKEDDKSRKMMKNEGIEIIRGGYAKGNLLAVNLNTLLKLAGTKYFPDFNETILFLEDDEDENASTVQRMLQQLKQIGVMPNINGIVFGRFQEKSKVDSHTLKKIIKNTINDFEIPIVSGLDFGHTDPMLSLPLGKKVEISTMDSKIIIEL